MRMANFGGALSQALARSKTGAPADRRIGLPEKNGLLNDSDKTLDLARRAFGNIGMRRAKRGGRAK